MNCDQAFDCLTDPQRRESTALTRHLADCRRCRAMRDALEPALDLFDELATEPDVSGFARPSSSVLSPETLRLAEQSAATLASGGRPAADSRRSWRVGLRYAAALLIGAALALALQSPANDGASDPRGVSQCLWLNREAESRLQPTSRAVMARCLECHTPQEVNSDGGVSIWRMDELWRLTCDQPRPDWNWLYRADPLPNVLERDRDSSPHATVACLTTNRTNIHATT